MQLYYCNDLKKWEKKLLKNFNKNIKYMMEYLLIIN